MHPRRSSLVAGSLALLTFASVAGCSQLASPQATAVHPTVAKIAADYAGYRKLTPAPVLVHSAFWTDCGGDAFGPAGVAKLEAARLAQYGPHTERAVLVYMNDPAYQAYGTAGYPVGSVVVKQKLLLTGGPGEQKVAGPAGVGGMVKRGPGYDPKNGDWEYFYFETAANIQSGRIQSCVDCHARAQSSGHVFGGWARPPSQ